MRILMNYLFLISGLCYFGIGIFAISRHRITKSEIVFFVLCVTLSFLSFNNLMQNSSYLAVKAVFYRNFGTVYMSLSYPLFLHFLMSLKETTKKNSLGFNPIIPIMYIPAFIAIYIYCIKYPFSPNSLFVTPLGWAYTNMEYPSAIAKFYFPVYVCIYILLSVFLIALRRFRGDLIRREKALYAVLLACVITISLIGMGVMVITPNLETPFLPPIGIILFAFSFLLCYFSFTKYAVFQANMKMLLSSIVTNTDDGVIFSDSNNIIFQANQVAYELFHIPKSETMIGKKLSDVFSYEVINDKFWKKIYRSVNNSKNFYYLITYSPNIDSFGNLICAAYTIRDVTEFWEYKEQLEKKIKENAIFIRNEVISRKKSEDMLYDLTYRDPLTGVPNRPVIMEKLEKILSSSPIDGSVYHTIITMNLGDFQIVNYNYGYKVGDETLKYFVKVVQKLLNEKEQLARLGGDEFILVLEDTKEQRLYELLRALSKEFRETIMCGGNKINLTLNYGYSEFPKDATSLDKLLIIASKRLRNSKSKYKRKEP